MKRKDVEGYDVFCGIDVGKAGHCCRALSPDGESELLSRVVAQDEAELARLFSDLSGMGRVLAVVDQARGFGALVVAVAGGAGVDVAHVTPGRFSKVAQASGEAKTDRVDALALARLPIEMPRVIDPVVDLGETVGEARALSRYRAGVVGERARAYNRVHDALNRCCPPLERLLSGPGLHAKAALAALARYGALGLAAARKSDVERWAMRQSGLGPAAAEAVEEMRLAARSQETELPAAGVLDELVRAECARIAEICRTEDDLDARLDELCSALPEVAICRSMPGIGEVYARTIVLEVGDVSRFRSGPAMAAYMGVGKCPRESGAKRGGKRRRSYNRRLRQAMFGSARIAIRRPGPDRDYYEKKLAGSMNAHQALHALVRKRAAILYAMLKNMEPYRTA